MALYHKWDVKNDFAYVLQFFSLISESLGSVKSLYFLGKRNVPVILIPERSKGGKMNVFFFSVHYVFIKKERKNEYADLFPLMKAGKQFHIYFNHNATLQSDLNLI